jgi:hypothetical protein
MMQNARRKIARFLALPHKLGNVFLVLTPPVCAVLVYIYAVRSGGITHLPNWRFLAIACIMQVIGVACLFAVAKNLAGWVLELHLDHEVSLLKTLIGFASTVVVLALGVGMIVSTLHFGALSLLPATGLDGSLMVKAGPLTAFLLWTVGYFLLLRSRKTLSKRVPAPYRQPTAQAAMPSAHIYAQSVVDPDVRAATPSPVYAAAGASAADFNPAQPADVDPDDDLPDMEDDAEVSASVFSDEPAREIDHQPFVPDSSDDQPTTVDVDETDDEEVGSGHPDWFFKEFTGPEATDQPLDDAEAVTPPSSDDHVPDDAPAAAFMDSPSDPFAVPPAADMHDAQPSPAPAPSWEDSTMPMAPISTGDESSPAAGPSLDAPPPPPVYTPVPMPVAAAMTPAEHPVVVVPQDSFDSKKTEPSGKRPKWGGKRRMTAREADLHGEI